MVAFVPLLAIRAADFRRIVYHFRRTWSWTFRKMAVTFDEIAGGKYIIAHFAVAEASLAVTANFVTAHKLHTMFTVLWDFKVCIF